MRQSAKEPGCLERHTETEAASCLAGKVRGKLAEAVVQVKDLEGGSGLDRAGRVGALKALKLLLTFADGALKTEDDEATVIGDYSSNALVLPGASRLKVVMEDLQKRITVVREAWDTAEMAVWAAMIPEAAAVAVGDGTPGNLRQPLTAAEQAVVSVVWNHTDDDINLVCSLAAGVGMSKVILMGKHFGRMRNGWLFDESVNAYMFLLQERDKKACAESAGAKTPSHFMGSFFFEKVLPAKTFNKNSRPEWTTGDCWACLFTKRSPHPPPQIIVVFCQMFENSNRYSYKSVKRWGKTVAGGDVFALDKLVIPVNISHSHWCLCVAHVKERRIQFYDSLGGTGAHYCEGLKRFLQDEAKKQGDEV